MKKKTKLIAAALTLSFASMVFADDLAPKTNIYAFGPNCGSAGQWTRKAFQESQQLIATIKSLESDPNCRGITSLVNLMSSVQNSAGASTGDDSGGNPAVEPEAQVQNKLAALSSIATSGDENMTPFAARAQRAFTREALESSISTPVQAQKRFSLAKGRSAVLANGARAANLSASLLTQVAEALPNYQTCLIGRPSEVGVAITSIVNIGAAIAGSNTGISPTMSHLVESILNLVRSDKFSSAVAKLNQEQLNQSLSCLMEVSTESYCSVLDMQHIIETPRFVPRTKSEITPSATKSYSTTPLSGYYVLTVHLPNIYRWVQSVQFGVPARVETDAKFKTDAMALVDAFQQRAQTLPSLLSEAESQIEKLPNPEARKEQLLTTIKAIVGRMLDLNPGGTNFFTQTENEFVLPFYLLDEGNNVPGCIFQTSSGTVCDPWTQLNVPGKFPRLDNIDQIYLGKIRERLKTLSDGAGEKASIYYQSRVIVNNVSLAVNSLNGTTYSVKDSFEFVLNYLNYLRSLISDQGRDDENLMNILPAINNAYNRFDKILQSYDSLKQLQRLDPRQPDYNDLVDQAYAKVIKEVYDQFQILWQKDGYVVATLNDFVSAEYRLRIKKGIGLEDYERQFLIISSKDLIDTIKSANFTNRTDIATDLSSANVINNGNLEGLDSLFFDSFYRSIQVWNQRILGKDTSISGLNKLSRRSAYMDANHSKVIKEENPNIIAFCKWGGPLLNTICAKILHPDRYPWNLSTSVSTMNNHDTAHHDYQRKRDILCLQSLAFIKRRARFDSAKTPDSPARLDQGLCDHVNLQSDYWNEIPDDKKKEFSNLNADYDQLLAATQIVVRKGDKKAEDARAKAEDNAICAYRNFRRNNMIYWLTKDADERVSKPLSRIISERQLRSNSH